MTAENNDMTPERESELARDLARFTDESSDEYDPYFTARIREIRPDWFEDDAESGGEEEGPVQD